MTSARAQRIQQKHINVEIKIKIKLKSKSNREPLSQGCETKPILCMTLPPDPRWEVCGATKCDCGIWSRPTNISNTRAASTPASTYDKQHRKNLMRSIHENPVITKDDTREVRPLLGKDAWRMLATVKVKQWMDAQMQQMTLIEFKGCQAIPGHHFCGQQRVQEQRNNTGRGIGNGAIHIVGSMQ